MTPENEKKFASIERFAKLLDSEFTLPGTKFKFGIDPILSLIPVVGSFSGMLVSFILIIMAVRRGASGKVVIYMLGNVLLDSSVGEIPVIGNIFDFTYKSNQRNVTLLKEHYIEGKHQGSGIGIIIGVLVIMFLLMLSMLYFIWKVLQWLQHII